ncbi:MAG TPA: SGNH/GDSL hydrolase family protein [Kineosporiaceae bacterium]|nr:SGNH/GDSL hydrolase family protein [Kineosporiaceae bacterium]
MTRIDPAGLESFVALGDSFTEGLEDERGPDGRHRGWADRVAAALATSNGRVRYANLAIRGRLLDQVIAEQVPAAIELSSSLVSFHAGPNDVLRPRVDLPALLARYEGAVERLRSTGAQVLLFTVIGRAGGTGRTADLLAARFGAFNETAREVARRHDCLLVDMGATAALQDRRLWHEDRLHLAPAGHARVAAAVLEELGFSDPELLAGAVGWWREPLPAVVRHGSTGRVTDLLADVRWARRYFLPWVGRRLRGVSSGDLLTAKQVALVDVVPGVATSPSTEPS